MENQPPTILVADDDPDIREIIVSAAEKAGGHVIEAGDGAEAWRYLNEVVVDVAILDVMMPEMSGLEVCEKLKNTEFGKLIPIIVLTARDGLRDKVDALELGADDYLTKPFQFKELTARIRAQLRVRELTLELQDKNRKLGEVQEQLLRKERRIVASQLAGTAAHKLGQPLSAMMLNCAILDKVDSSDERFVNALKALQSDIQRMKQMLEGLRAVDGNETEVYHSSQEILK